MTTIKKLNAYRKALQEWKDKGGLDGGGGKATRQKDDGFVWKREHVDEPKPETFGLTGYDKCYSDQIRKQVIP